MPPTANQAAPCRNSPCEYLGCNRLRLNRAVMSANAEIILEEKVGEVTLEANEVEGGVEDRRRSR